MRCKLCGDKKYGVIKLNCKHKIGLSCILKSNNLRCKICNKIFYDELSIELLKRLCKNIKSN
jgi:hypothetical protein